MNKAELIPTLMIPSMLGLLFGWVGFMFVCLILDHINWRPSMLIRKLGKLLLMSYIPMAILMGAFNSHRNCALSAHNPKWDPADRFICSVATGLIWPVWLSSRVALAVTDPALWSDLKLPMPTLKWE